MLLLTSITDQVRLTTSAATTTIEVHTSYMDVDSSVSPSLITPLRTNTRITTATTTTIVPSPASGKQRNVKAIYVTNNSVGTSCNVGVEHTDGTNVIELIKFVLLPGENLGYREDGSWIHRDKQGAEYPPAGLGSYTGNSISFMKNGVAVDTVGYWGGSYRVAGFPGAWAPGTPGVNGRITDGTTAADAGCIPIPNPTVGGNYLTEIQLQSAVNHSHFFYDVLWVNSGLSVTTLTEQAIASPTLPARDLSGTTNGAGCVIGLYFIAASTLAATNALSTVRYTNSDGVAGRVATLTAIAGSRAPATPVIGTVLWYGLAAGDKGVRSIQGFTIGGTSWLTGTISLFIARDIAMMGTTIPNVAAQKIIGMPGIRLYNGTCLHHAILGSATTSTFITGELVVMEK